MCTSDNTMYETFVGDVYTEFYVPSKDKDGNEVRECPTPALKRGNDIYLLNPCDNVLEYVDCLNDPTIKIGKKFTNEDSYMRFTGYDSPDYRINEIFPAMASLCRIRNGNSFDYDIEQSLANAVDPSIRLYNYLSRASLLGRRAQHDTPYGRCMHIASLIMSYIDASGKMTMDEFNEIIEPIYATFVAHPDYPTFSEFYENYDFSPHASDSYPYWKKSEEERLASLPDISSMRLHSCKQIST